MQDDMQDDLHEMHEMQNNLQTISLVYVWCAKQYAGTCKTISKTVCMIHKICSSMCKIICMHAMHYDMQSNLKENASYYSKWYA